MLFFKRPFYNNERPFYDDLGFPATHKRPLEIASHAPTPASMDGPVGTLSPRMGAGSHKRPLAAAEDLTLPFDENTIISLPVVISDASSDEERNPADPPVPDDSEPDPVLPKYSPCEADSPMPPARPDPDLALPVSPGDAATSSPSI